MDVLLLLLPVLSLALRTENIEYLGLDDGPGTTTKRDIAVMIPDDDGPFPVFFFFMGTGDTWGVSAFQEMGERVTELGYASALVDYNNQDFCVGNPCEDEDCIFSFYTYLGIPTTESRAKMNNLEKARSLKKAVTATCVQDWADCDKGVAVSGHSQGAFLSILLAQIDDRVNAGAFLSPGYFSQPPEGQECFVEEAVGKHLPKEKRLYIIGENDSLNGRDEELDMKAMQDFSGYSCEGDSAPIDCVTEGEGGYYVIGESDFSKKDKSMTDKGGTELAGHSYFVDRDPIGAQSKFLPTFASDNPKSIWQLGNTLGWLTEAAKVPEKEDNPLRCKDIKKDYAKCADRADCKPTGKKGILKRCKRNKGFKCKTLSKFECQKSPICGFLPWRKRGGKRPSCVKRK